jgi:hypothetical protein
MPAEARAYWAGYWACQQARDEQSPDADCEVKPPNGDKVVYADNWTHYLQGWQLANQEASDQ